MDKSNKYMNLMSNNLNKIIIIKNYQGYDHKLMKK